MEQQQLAELLLKDNKMDEVEVKNEMCMECCVYNGDFYRLTDWINGRAFLAKVDFDGKDKSDNKIELTKYCDEDTEPLSFYEYKNKLYMPGRKGRRGMATGYRHSAADSESE